MSLDSQSSCIAKLFIRTLLFLGLYGPVFGPIYSSTSWADCGHEFDTAAEIREISAGNLILSSQLEQVESVDDSVTKSVDNYLATFEAVARELPSLGMDYRGLIHGAIDQQADHTVGKVISKYLKSSHSKNIMSNQTALGDSYWEIHPPEVDLVNRIQFEPGFGKKLTELIEEKTRETVENIRKLDPAKVKLGELNLSSEFEVKLLIEYANQLISRNKIGILEAQVYHRLQAHARGRHAVDRLREAWFGIDSSKRASVTGFAWAILFSAAAIAAVYFFVQGVLGGGGHPHYCFSGTTDVCTVGQNGEFILKPIKDIRVGDTVQSFDMGTGQFVTAKVRHLWIHPEVKPIAIKVLIDDEPFWIVTTPEHPFLNGDDRGQTIIPAGKSLGKNLLLRTKKGELTSLEVLEIAEDQASEPVYNLDIEGSHTYLVGPGILVHNMTKP